MRTFNHFLILFVTFTLNSCQQILDNYWERKEEENYTSSFKGKYVGSYNGDETGTIVLEVDKKGYVTVARNSSLGVNEIFISGVIQDTGGFQAVKSQSGFTLLGNLNAKSGTWKMGGWKGNWSVIKQ